MDEIKRPFFVVALVALLAVVGVELGSSLFIAPADVTAEQLASTLRDEGFGPDQIAEAVASLDDLNAGDDPPGVAITALAMIDGLLLLSMVGLGLALVVPHRILARVIAPTNLIVTFILVVAGIIGVLVLLALLFLMIGLFLAVPFGTIAYLARWGFFPRGEAQAILGILLLLKLIFCGFAVAASPRLVTQKGIVALVLTSLVLQIVVGFLHAIVPLPLVSILDVLGALVIVIVGIVWSIVIFVGSLIGTIRLIKVRT